MGKTEGLTMDSSIGELVYNYCDELHNLHYIDILIIILKNYLCDNWKRLYIKNT